MTLREQICSLQERLDQWIKEAACYKQALDEALAQTQHNFGFGYASKEEKVIKFYTGISVGDFCNILRIIGDGAENMDYSGIEDGSHNRVESRGPGTKLSKEDEVFLPLIKLRHNFPESDLAARFHVTQPTVYRVFRTWLLCLSFSFR